ncbi:hypothetical protein GYMLUDRAFT_250679 [Collybiopsis luxurians FD-317 M1]|uniref:Uncharacterized protein n=1 Tax=Collybiopsis luxurians FD-317 M1 TaxID=944289 RepID=A0A0D0ARV2_9AGAR|nr:hypothetical protein GYMLUDRAFT_250679 [Collybiopsis luxurians FD-317 M1]
MNADVNASTKDKQDQTWLKNNSSSEYAIPKPSHWNASWLIAWTSTSQHPDRLYFHDDSILSYTPKLDLRYLHDLIGRVGQSEVRLAASKDASPAYKSNQIPNNEHPNSIVLAAEGNDRSLLPGSSSWMISGIDTGRTVFLMLLFLPTDDSDSNRDHDDGNGDNDEDMDDDAEDPKNTLTLTITMMTRALQPSSLPLRTRIPWSLHHPHHLSDL